MGILQANKIVYCYYAHKNNLINYDEMRILKIKNLKQSYFFFKNWI